MKKQLTNCLVFGLSFIIAIKLHLLAIYWLFAYVFIIRLLARELDKNKLIKRFINLKLKKIWSKN